MESDYHPTMEIYWKKTLIVAFLIFFLIFLNFGYIILQFKTKYVSFKTTHPWASIDRKSTSSLHLIEKFTDTNKQIKNT